MSQVAVSLVISEYEEALNAVSAADARLSLAEKEVEDAKHADESAGQLVASRVDRVATAIRAVGPLPISGNRILDLSNGSVVVRKLATVDALVEEPDVAPVA